MAISTYGELKSELSAYLFHQRFIARYDNLTAMFEADANSRLRVLPMQTSTSLTTVSGDVALPTDYLSWRTIRDATRTDDDELEYVHPAYLPPSSGTAGPYPKLFTIEGSTLKIRPVNDDADAWEFHYYQKVPTLVGDNANTNWLLTEYPNAYLFGLMAEAAALGRNVDMAQLYKARRDEVLAELIQRYALTTGASSPQVRTAEFF